MNKYSRPLEKDVVPLQPDVKNRMPNYREKLVEWNPFAKKNAALFYQFDTGSRPDELNVEVIPDTCVDILFCCSHSPSASVYGANLAQSTLQLQPHATYFGFKPYTTRGMRPLRASWRELVDGEVALEELAGEKRIVEDIRNAHSFEQRIRIFRAFAHTHLLDPQYFPDLVEFSEILMCQAKGSVKVQELSEELGYTGRHCREKFKEAHGISIKSYNEMLRFQNTVRMMEGPEQSIADIVYENSYYDQSHFIREFKKFTGHTPVDFRKQYVG